MFESGVTKAIATEAEAGESLGAAQAEQERGQSSSSIGLLQEAIAKERKSLELWEQGIETLRRSLEERRHALDQQEEILNGLSGELTSK
jgi:flagellar biosynthesis chaperone FliJ